MIKDDIVGKVFVNKIGLLYVVIKECPDLQKLTEYYYEIEFLNTRTRKICEKRNIKKGVVFDQYNPHKYGVGYIGNASSKAFNGKVYKKWDAMLSRCYNQKKYNV